MTYIFDYNLDYLLKTVEYGNGYPTTTSMIMVTQLLLY